MASVGGAAKGPLHGRSAVREASLTDRQLCQESVLTQALDLKPDRLRNLRIVPEQHAEFDIPLVGRLREIRRRDECGVLIDEDAF